VEFLEYAPVAVWVVEQKMYLGVVRCGSEDLGLATSDGRCGWERWERWERWDETENRNRGGRGG